MRHTFMEDVAARLADRRIATFRYNFPYMEMGRRPPNRAPVLVATVRAAVAEAARLAPDLPVVAGGKSMGGRMTSTAAAEEALPGVKGIGFFGFPLHPPGKPGSTRGDHLTEVELPMLFLQGTRDKLADLDLLRPVLKSVTPGPTLHVVEGARSWLSRAQAVGADGRGSSGRALRPVCEVGAGAGVTAAVASTSVPPGALVLPPPSRVGILTVSAGTPTRRGTRDDLETP